MGETVLPMAGVRVIDLATFIAAPFATGVLGEFGAEVIKVEHPDGGDPMRRFGTPTDDAGRTLAWLSEARNKISITADLKTEEGRDLLLDLVRRSDVLAENFRPGTLERWGLSPEVLLDANPRLVILRVSGYGQTGPYRDRPGFARIAHAYGGLTHLAGMPGEPPVTPGSTSLADYVSGLYGAIGILLALRSVAVTGRGQVIDVALFESIFRLLDEVSPAYDREGKVRGREGVMTATVCPHGHFPCQDDQWVAIACTSDRMWERFAEGVLGRPDLVKAYPTTQERLSNRAMIDGLVSGYTSSRRVGDVVQDCVDAEVPCGPVNSIADIFDDPHFAARGAIESVVDEMLGAVAVPSVFPRLSDTPGRITSLGPRFGAGEAYVREHILGCDKEVRAWSRKQ